MSSLGAFIADNARSVRQRIDAAARRVGRSGDDVKLVAVTKYVGTDEIAALIDAGCLDLGESRPQALWDRAVQFRHVPGLRWHLIGHLQRNKVARTIPLVELIHSVDSERLLAEIDGEAARQNRQVRVLLEVNTSGEAAKHGVPPETLGTLLAAAAKLAHVRVEGLMTMAAREGDLEVARENFTLLKRLRDQAAVPVMHLSMGMSGDFETAIEAGATIVRVGSALFE